MKGKNGVEFADILKFKTIIDLLSNIFIKRIVYKE